MSSNKQSFMEEKKKLEETYAKEFGVFIKELRNEKKWSINDVGDKLNVSGNFISQLERGVKNATDDMIQNLSQIYGVSEDLLFRKVGKVPISVLEELKENTMLQKAISYVSKKKLSEEKKKQMEEEILRVYAEFLNVHKEDILKEEYANELTHSPSLQLIVIEDYCLMIQDMSITEKIVKKVRKQEWE